MTLRPVALLGALRVITGPYSNKLCHEKKFPKKQPLKNSFNDKESVFVDRFIEVKSYSENAVFHWSQNEIETAKELAEKYFLYLVDRNKMSQSGYAPRIFQNPYQKIFENELWEKEPETWRVSAPRENQT